MNKCNLLAITGSIVGLLLFMGFPDSSEILQYEDSENMEDEFAEELNDNFDYPDDVVNGSMDLQQGDGSQNNGFTNNNSAFTASGDDSLERACGPKPLDGRDPGLPPPTEEEKEDWLTWWECARNYSKHKRIPCRIFECIQNLGGGITDQKIPGTTEIDLMCSHCNTGDMPSRLKCISDEIHNYVGDPNTGFGEGQHNCNDYSSIANEVLNGCRWQLGVTFKSACANSDGEANSGHSWLRIRTGGWPGVCYAFDPLNRVLITTPCGEHD